MIREREYRAEESFKVIMVEWSFKMNNSHQATVVGSWENTKQKKNAKHTKAHKWTIIAVKPSISYSNEENQRQRENLERS